MPPKGKGALVDKYAEIALYDAAENQRVIMEAQAAAREKKQQMKIALDVQVQMQQAKLKKEKEEDTQWVRLQQERIKIWNEEEKYKIISTQQKETKIKVQREQQLRELAALRKRDEQEQQKYDQGILRSIHQEIMMEKAKEKMKRESDALNLQMVADQNALHREHCKQLKEKEIDDARKLEAQWTGLLDKQERQRSRQLKQTYARQALQYKASSTMQQIQDQQSAEDEARADGHAAEKERQAAAREQAQKDERARLQQETLEVLAIQVREKASRAQADAQRESMVGERERMELERAEKAASKRRSMTKTRYSDYAQELAQQMAVQEERKVLEPYLMSKAERQMNAALLRKLPGGVEF